MANLSQTTLLKLPQISRQLIKEFHCNSVVCVNRKWREERNLPKNPNSFGPLTNFPDYSFKDGRPVPYGTHQKRRIDEQREILTKIQTLAGQIDYAVERHKYLQQQAEEERRQILDRKLKEKGDKVLITSGSEQK